MPAGEKEMFWKRTTLCIPSEDVIKPNVHNPADVSKYTENLENPEAAQFMNRKRIQRLFFF